jgi:iron complex outermembrane recepter protein
MKLIFTLLTLLVVYRAGAQNKPDSVAMTFPDISGRLPALSRSLSEVTVTAYQGAERLISVAGSVSVILADSLRFSGHNIVSVLSESPGLIIQEATPGTMKVTLRGIGSRYPYGTKKIKMFFDGIPLYSAEGETYFDDIGPENIGRIEVLRGPASSIYGASLGGAVLLYPAKLQRGSSSLSLMSSAGSNGYFKNTVSYSKSTPKDQLLLSFTILNYGGYRSNSSYNRQSVMLMDKHRFSAKLSGSLLIFGSHIYSEIPSSIDSVTFANAPRSAAPTWLKTHGNKKPERILAGYSLKFRPSDGWEISGTVYSTARKSDEVRPFNILGETDLTYGGRFLASYERHTGSAGYRIAGGADLFYEVYFNSIHENTDGVGKQGGLIQQGRELLQQSDFFSQADLTISDFKITAGANLDKSGFRFTDLWSADTVDQSGFYSFKPVFSPRLSFSWNRYKWLSAYLAVNNGFSMPGLSETMTPLGLINRDIRPEKAWSYEAGARFSLLEGRSFADISAFRMRVKDLIVPRRVEEDVYVGMNAGASLHEGIELEVRQVLWGNEDKLQTGRSAALIRVSASLGSYRFLEFTDGSADYSGKKLPGIPGFTLNGAFDLKTGSGISGEAEVISYSGMELNDSNSGRTSGWGVLNLRGGYSMKPGQRTEIDLLLAVNNVMDTRYASMIVVNATGTAGKPPRYYYPGPPLTVTFSAAFRFGFKGSKG